MINIKGDVSGVQIQQGCTNSFQYKGRNVGKSEIDGLIKVLSSLEDTSLVIIHTALEAEIRRRHGTN